MNTPDSLKWLDWCSRLQALAQTGLNYAQDKFDIERYQAIREIAAEMISAGTASEIGKVRALLAGDAGHTTPKVDVRGVICCENKVLLVRERSDGKWTLPGGWADVSESPAENVTREIREESGYETRATKLLAILDRSKHPHAPQFPFHVYKLFFRCEILSGAPVLNVETDAVEFFGESELPELSITRVTEAQVHRMFEHLRNPDLAPDFDA